MTALLEREIDAFTPLPELPLRELPLSEQPLADVVFAAQYGDRDAFGELFTRFERLVYSIALRRLGDHAEAQELCQEVFIQAMEKLGQLREPEAIAGWLTSITNRMAINRVVRRRPIPSAEPS